MKRRATSKSAEACLLFALSCIAFAGQSSAQDAAHLNVRIQWQGAQPSAVFRQEKNTGTREIKPITNPLPIQYKFPVASQNVLVRSDNSFGSHVLAFLPRFSTEYYDLILELPTSSDCNTERVRNIVSSINDVNASKVANATLMARHLVTSNACGPANADRLEEAVFDGYRRLTVIGDVFAMPDIEWGRYATRARLAQRDVRERRLISLYRSAQAERNERTYEALDGTLGVLNGLYASDDWTATFASVKVTQDDLRHLEVESLYSRAIALRDDGDLEAARAFSSELADRASIPDYEIVFTQAVSGVTANEAIEINNGIKRRLAQASEASNIEMR